MEQDYFTEKMFAVSSVPAHAMESDRTILSDCSVSSRLFETRIRDVEDRIVGTCKRQMITDAEFKDNDFRIDLSSEVDETEMMCLKMQIERFNEQYHAKNIFVRIFEKIRIKIKNTLLCFMKNGSRRAV